MLCPVVPQPKSFFAADETPVFVLTGGVRINCETFPKAENELLRFIRNDLKLLPEEASQGVIVFLCRKDYSEEEYSLKVEPGKVSVCASADKGAFRGVQTLRQLLIANSLRLPEMMINDSPAFSYRGFMLDSARHFFPKEDVLRFIDIMALHKLNKLHWHLSDDQGWRLELYSKLRLAQVGGFRAGTNFDSKPHGGFYSQQDIEEIVAYANDRFIEIIPELDSPGHTVAAIAAYPELSCKGKELNVATFGGVKDDVLCPGKESVFDFMRDVWSETIKLFGAKCIHLGGDEVSVVRWKECPDCKKRMAEEGLESENELLPYYINRLFVELSETEAECIAWSDSAEAQGFDERITHAFHGTNENERDLLSRAGNSKIINTCSSAYRFDMPHGVIKLKDAFDYNPKISKNVIGAECCLRTEHVADFDSACVHLFPRIAAFSESAWGADKPDYNAFKAKLDAYCFMLSAYGFSYVRPEKADPGALRSAVQRLLSERRLFHRISKK